MKLWRISQTESTGYDTYDSAVVAAETEDAARCLHPSGDQDTWTEAPVWRSSWASAPASVKVEYLGEGSGEARIICASYKAG